MKLTLVSKIAGFEPFFAAGELAKYKKEIETRYNISKEEMERIVKAAEMLSKEASNEPKKYTPWILKLISIGPGKGMGTDVNNEGQLIDAYPKLLEYLKAYDLKLKNKNQRPEGFDTNFIHFDSIDAMKEELKKGQSNETSGKSDDDLDFGKSNADYAAAVIETFKEGKELKGATKLFQDGEIRIYMVTGTNPENHAALYMMSGKHPGAVQKKIDAGADSDTVTQAFGKKCTWCTSFKSGNNFYLKQGGKHIMFYGSDGYPLYELTRKAKKGSEYEFHTGTNHPVSLKELTKLIRKHKLDKDTVRAEMWDVLSVVPEIANDIVDNPEKHPNSV